MPVKNGNIVEKLGKQAEARIYVQIFHGKTTTNNKPKTKGNKEQNDGQTDNHYIQPEMILPIRRIRTLHRAPETSGGPLALKDVLILVLFLILASGSENMNERFF